MDELYRELTAALEACGRPYEILAIDDGSTDDTFARLGRAAGLGLQTARHPVPPQFRPDGRFAAGFAHARGRYIVTMDGDLQNDPRDIAAMVTRARAAAGRHHRGMAQGSKRQVLQPPAPLDGGEPHHLEGHRREAARLRVLAEGLSCRSRQADEALRRDAPLPAGDRQRVRGDDGRDGREPSGAAARHVEVRDLAHDSGDPRSPDGQVPDQLPHAPGADLRAVGSSHGPARRAHSARGWPTCGFSTHAGHRRSARCCSSASC